MIGQGENRWRYDFSCKKCANTRIEPSGTYCIPMREGRKVIFAGDDFVVRCTEYIGEQLDLFSNQEKENLN